LLAERTKIWRDYATLFKEIMTRFQEYYAHGSRVSYQLVPLPQYKELPADRPSPDRCDLGTGLRATLNALPVQPDTQVEVFIFLQNELGGEWKAPLSELTRQRDIGVHVFWLRDLDPKLSIEEKTEMVGLGVKLAELSNQGKYAELVGKVLRERAVRAGWKPQVKEEHAPGFPQTAAPPAEPGAMPAKAIPAGSAIIPASEGHSAIQPVPAPDGADPRSLQIFVPQQVPDQPSAAELTPRPKATIPFSQPISEPPPAASTTEERQAGSPAVPAPAIPEAGSEVAVTETQAAEASAHGTEAENIPEKQPIEAGEAPPAKVEVEAATRQPAEQELPVQPPAAKPEPELPVGKDGVASNWKNLEPPAELEDRVPHTATMRLEAGKNWLMAAASRRGKMHAHQGIFREDAFGLGHAEGWNFMIVADGGGSRSLARVGSRLAAEAGIAAMIEEAHNQAKSSSSLDNVCSYILLNALRKAYDALRKEAQNRERKIDDFGTTFLAVAHHPAEKQHIIGTLQVGDGLIAAMLPDRPPMVLADPDVGESASQTLFLTSKPANEWMSRIKIYDLELEPAMVVCMCDGVSDDLIPYKTNLPTLFAFLSDMVGQTEPDKALLEFLGYDKRGSFDDRTLAVQYPRQAAPLKPLPAVEQESVPQPDRLPDDVKAGDASVVRRKSLHPVEK
jgi:hypothetical protein